MQPVVHMGVRKPEWPRWAQWVYARRQPGEIGIGDTARRLLAQVGGEQYKLLVRNVGLPCKCAMRQAEWNTKYPYLDQLGGKAL